MMILYHGTDKDAGSKILRTQSFQPSRGDEHWLGDGIYFYQDKYYAFRWIYLAYHRKCKNCLPTKKNILKRYEILAASVDLKSDRIFDMTYIEHQMIFDKAFEASVEKIKKRNPRIKIADGVVFNILFYKIGYRKDFDAIKGAFIHDNKKAPRYDTRFHYALETQYCVVNKEVIFQVKQEIMDAEDDSYFSFAKEYNNKSFGIARYASANKVKYKS